MLVPRPISSRMTRLRAVALLRMLAVSFISTMKVDCPLASSSCAPTRVKMRSTRPMVARSAGTNEPICASSDDQRHLAQIGGFAAHVRAGDDVHAAVGVQAAVVGDVRRPAIADASRPRDAARRRSRCGRSSSTTRADVVVAHGGFGEAGSTSSSATARATARTSDAASATRSRTPRNSSYSSSTAFSSAPSTLRLVLLQFGRDVALAVGGGLLADVVGRHFARGWIS